MTIPIEKALFQSNSLFQSKTHVSAVGRVRDVAPVSVQTDKQKDTSSKKLFPKHFVFLQQILNEYDRPTKKTAPEWNKAGWLTKKQFLKIH